MRKIATLTRPVNGIQRLMLYEADGGTNLFLYTCTDDGPCKYDHWYESPGDAKDAAAESFGIKSQDWMTIDDPAPDAQHDWIRPTRVKCDSGGTKLWDQFEMILPTG